MRKVSPISRHTPQSWFQSVTKPMAPWAQSFDPWPEIAKFPVDCPLNSTTKLNKEWPKLILASGLEVFPCTTTWSVRLRGRSESEDCALESIVVKCWNKCLIKNCCPVIQEVFPIVQECFPKSSRVFSYRYSKIIKHPEGIPLNIPLFTISNYHPLRACCRKGPAPKVEPQAEFGRKLN